MLLDGLLSLFALRPRQCFRGLWLAVNEAVLRRVLLGLTPFGLFACAAQIDDWTHADARCSVHAATRPGTDDAENVTIPLVRGNTRLFERIARPGRLTLRQLCRARLGVRFFRFGEVPGAVDQARPVRRFFVQYGDPGVVETLRNDGAGRHL